MVKERKICENSKHQEPDSDTVATFTLPDCNLKHYNKDAKASSLKQSSKHTNNRKQGI